MMTNTESASPLGIWHVAQCPFVIEYDVAVLRYINREVTEGYRALPHGGLEVGGLLLGRFSGDRMRITGYEPILCEHAHGPSFQLSEIDKRSLSERLQHYADCAQSGSERVVGWYHSHTRSGLSLTPEDTSIHDKLFPEEWQVALLLQPDVMGGARAGFFFREPGGVAMRTSASYEEFTIEPDPLSIAVSPRSSMAMRRAAAQAGAAENSASVSVMPVAPALAALPVSEALPVARERSKTRWGVWATLLIMFLTALGAVLYLRVYYAPDGRPRPAASFVRVETVYRGGNLDVTWDTRNLGEVKQGQLDIEDGPLQTRIMLDQKTLASGSVSYAYKSDVTGFHLRVERTDGSALEGSTTYVAPPKAPQHAGKQEEVTAIQESALEPDANTQSERKPEAQAEPQSAAPEPVSKPAATPPQNPTSTPATIPVTSADRAKSTEPQPASMPKLDLEGHWELSAGSASRSSGKPEAVVIRVTEANGGFQGTLSARYKSGKPQSLVFSGRMVNGVARFPWITREGVHGEIEFLAVPNVPDTMKVVWYGPDVKQVFEVHKVN